MTENLLQQLEEKVISLLSEMEILRNELKQLRHENHTLKNERITSTEKLRTLIQQLDSLIDTSSLSKSYHYEDKETVLA